MNLINDQNKKTVVSSVSPSCGAKLDNTYFLCHICPYSTDMYKNWKYGTYEHPLVKNIGAMFHHLHQAHCNKPRGERQLTVVAESYLTVIMEDIEQGLPSPLLQTTTSIPKSSSHSCLEILWKSNQPELTKKNVNAYCFNAKLCKGHTKLVPTSGIEYWYDLANSVYCTCKNETMGKYAPNLIHDKNWSMAPEPSFFKQAKQSFVQTHRTLLPHCFFL